MFTEQSENNRCSKKCNTFGKCNCVPFHRPLFFEGLHDLCLTCVKIVIYYLLMKCSFYRFIAEMEMSSSLLGSNCDVMQSVESDLATELRNPIHHHSRWACFYVEQFVMSPFFPIFLNLLSLVGLREDVYELHNATKPGKHYVCFIFAILVVLHHYLP